MEPALTFIILWLAAYRVTRFITSDTLIDRSRRELFLRFPPTEAWARFERQKLPNGMTFWQEQDTPRKTSKIGELFNCPWCIGVWIAGAAVLLALPFTSVPLPIAQWLAISAAIGLTARNLDA